MILHIYIRKDVDYGYYSQVLELPGVFSEGDTIEECIENTKEAIELALEDKESRDYYEISDNLLHAEYIFEDMIELETI